MHTSACSYIHTYTQAPYRHMNAPSGVEAIQDIIMTIFIGITITSCVLVQPTLGQ